MPCFGAAIWYSQCVVEHFFHSLFVHPHAIISAAAECDCRNIRPDLRAHRNKHRTHFSNFFHAASLPVTHFVWISKFCVAVTRINKKRRIPFFVAITKLGNTQIRKLLELEPYYLSECEDARQNKFGERVIQLPEELSLDLKAQNVHTSLFSVEVVQYHFM